MIPHDDDALSPSNRIDAAYARALAAHADQALHAQIDCLLAGGAGVPPHGGNCAKCTVAGVVRSHSLIRSLEAEREVRRFYNDIRAADALGGVPVTRLDDEKGNMLGALMCVDEHGNTQVLRAFSGFIDESGVNDAPGCCPMIPPPDQAAAGMLQDELDTVLIAIAGAEANVKTSRGLLRAAQSVQADKVKAVQVRITAIYKDKELGTKADKDEAAAPLKIEKAGIEALYADEQRAYDEAAAVAAPFTTRRDVLRDEISEQYSGARLLTNFAGDPRQTQRQACTDLTKVRDGRTGNCAAPKMIAEAQRLGWTPVAIAEIWIGHDQGTQKDFLNGDPNGTYVPSCECCRSILGFALCGLLEKQLAASVS